MAVKVITITGSNVENKTHDYDNGHRIDIAGEGHLIITGQGGTKIAIYAPGTWHHAEMSE